MCCGWKKRSIRSDEFNSVFRVSSGAELSVGLQFCGDNDRPDDFLDAHNLIPGIAFHDDLETAVSVTNKLLRRIG